MEPFGLFRFLKSILDATQPTTNDSPPISAPNAPEEKAFSNEKEEAASSASSPISSPTSSQDAFFNFISAHEARAKRTKPKR